MRVLLKQAPPSTVAEAETRGGEDVGSGKVIEALKNEGMARAGDKAKDDVADSTGMAAR